MTFVDRDLARRFERAEGHGASNCVDARLRVTPNANAARIEVGGTMAMCDGPDSPITQTFGLGLFEEATQFADLPATEQVWSDDVHQLDCSRDVAGSEAVHDAAIGIAVGREPVRSTTVQFRKSLRHRPACFEQEKVPEQMVVRNHSPVLSSRTINWFRLAVSANQLVPSVEPVTASINGPVKWSSTEVSSSR